MKLFSRKISVSFLPVLFIVGIIVYFLINVFQIRFIQDDAFTSFRYVKNFVEGNGLVFNTGERVEGYTNFLWVIILSVWMFVSKIFSLNLDMEIIAQGLSVFFCTVAVVEVYVLSCIFIQSNEENISSIRRILLQIARLVPSFLISISIPFLYWGVSAMETSMFVSLTILSIMLYLKSITSERPGKMFAVVSMLNTLTRPEGIFFFTLIMLHSLILNYMKQDEKDILRRVRKSFNKKFITELVFYAVPFIVYLCFRLIYYGYPFPNTFYAKTEFNTKFLLRGWTYFWEFAKPFLLYGALLFFPLILWRQKEIRIKFTLLYIIIIAWIATVIILGGDVLPINRFFLPILPLVFILLMQSLVYCIENIFMKRKYMIVPSLLAALLVAAAWGIENYNGQYETMMTKRAYESGLVKKMKIYAAWVNNQMEREHRKTSVAMSTIGAFSYNSDAHVIDLVGLTDEYIAHHPKEVKGITDDLPVLWKERHYNAEYILSKKPDYIIFPAGAKPSAFAECAVFVQPEFVNNYYTNIFYSEELNQLLPVFTRKKNITMDQHLNSISYDTKFLKHYITANNLFLKMLEENNRKLLKNIINECDKVIMLCPARYNDAITIKGYAYYHAKQIDEAERFLTEACNNNSTNMIARYYLKNIYTEKRKIYDAVRLMIEIKKFSPDALPYFNIQ